MAGRNKRGGHDGGTNNKGPIRFWGRHAVIAAIANPDRRVRKLSATREAMAELDIVPDFPVQYADVADLARFVPRDAPHQGLVAEVDPLGDVWLGDVLDRHSEDDRPLLILDQITDPHNVGAIFRSAAAFDAIAVVTQDRHAPPETGVVAKAASGALELVPWVRVVNLARALGELADYNYWRIALTGHTDLTLDKALAPRRNALVLGAEGDGIRHNVAENCDERAKLPISPLMESLNVSNAAAVALYAASMKRG